MHTYIVFCFLLLHFLQSLIWDPASVNFLMISSSSLPSPQLSHSFGNHVGMMPSHLNFARIMPRFYFKRFSNSVNQPVLESFLPGSIVESRNQLNLLHSMINWEARRADLAHFSSAVDFVGFFGGVEWMAAGR